MTARLDRLESVGLIQRTPDSADRRSMRIRLTRAGSELAVRALDAVIAADEAFLAPLSSPDRRLLAERMRQILLHAESADPSRRRA